MPGDRSTSDPVQHRFESALSLPRRPRPVLVSPELRVADRNSTEWLAGHLDLAVEEVDQALSEMAVAGVIRWQDLRWAVNPGRRVDTRRDPEAFETAAPAPAPADSGEILRRIRANHRTRQTKL